MSSHTKSIINELAKNGLYTTFNLLDAQVELYFKNYGIKRNGHDHFIGWMFSYLTGLKFTEEIHIKDVSLFKNKISHPIEWNNYPEEFFKSIIVYYLPEEKILTSWYDSLLIIELLEKSLSELSEEEIIAIYTEEVWTEYRLGKIFDKGKSFHFLYNKAIKIIEDMADFIDKSGFLTEIGNEIETLLKKEYQAQVKKRNSG